MQAEHALYDLPSAMRAPLIACLRGKMPANVALMRLCMAASSEQMVEYAVNAASECAGGSAVASLWRRTPGAFKIVNQILSVVDHNSASDSVDALLTRCAAAFDSAAALSPEASVALYSLGDPALLAAATDEIAEQMEAWCLLGREKTALEIGCGNGRFLEALAPRLGHITGLDISAAMIDAASRRCAHLPNVEVTQSDGPDLAFCASSSLDLIFAIDSLPYIVHCGTELVAHYFAEATRMLKPAGRFLILNYSYRGDDHQDVADVRAFSSKMGLNVLRAGARDFQLWDGVTFLLEKNSA